MSDSRQYRQSIRETLTVGSIILALALMLASPAVASPTNARCARTAPIGTVPTPTVSVTLGQGGTFTLSNRSAYSDLHAFNALTGASFCQYVTSYGYAFVDRNGIVRARYGRRFGTFTSATRVGVIAAAWREDTRD